MSKKRIIITFILSAILTYVGYEFDLYVDANSSIDQKYGADGGAPGILAMAGLPFGWYIVNLYKSNREYYYSLNMILVVKIVPILIKLIIAIIIGWIVAPFVAIWMIIQLFKSNKESNEIDY